jgi:predicted DNA-binding transcriptional regulator YafY
MRASRLLTLLLLLQNRGRLTAGQLAAELEVSVRTIYRDVDALHAAGIPLYGEAGHAGGYQLLDGFRTRLTGLTVGEAEALFLTGLPGPAAELGLGAVVATAQLKLAASLPPELRERTGRVAERFHLDAPGWYHDGDEAPELAVVADAVWQQRRLRVRYLRWAQPREVSRDIDPLGLVLKAGRWYVVADCAGQQRTYRVSNLLTVTALDETFDRPAGFDLTSYWRGYLAEFHDRRHTATATVSFAPRALGRLADLMDDATVRAVAQTGSEPDTDGRVSATIPIESVEHACLLLLRFGADITVLDPPELRAALRETASAIAAGYPAD